MFTYSKFFQLITLKSSERIPYIPLRYIKKKSTSKINSRQQTPIKHTEKESYDWDFDEGQESDFMDIHKTHKQHLREIQYQKEKQKLQIVKQKYFKEEQSPNFLTWQEIEQIRSLHANNPDEWTIEHLAEGFPALPGTIQKIVRSNYRKKDSKIRNHDESVRKNWLRFQNGELENLHVELKNHLKKFINRSNKLLWQTNEVQNKQEVSVSNNIGEFSELISSYTKLKQKNMKFNENTEKPDVQTNDTIKSFPKNSKTNINSTSVTFDELRQEVIEKVESKHGHLDNDDKLILSQYHSEVDEKNQESDSFKVIDIKVPDSVTIPTKDKIGIVEKTDKSLRYPEKIKIPRNKSFKNNKNSIYRLNDCYYDYDGEFLYKVSGMS